MNLGNALRICIVAGWLALFGSHALHYALPDLGLQERRDFSAVVAANLDHRFAYRIMQENRGQAPRQVGSCTLDFTRNDADYTLLTVIDYSDSPFAPVLAALLPARAAPRNQRIELRIAETLDDRLRLIALSADAAIHGHQFSAHGAVGSDGLTGTWQFDGGAPTRFVRPEITHEASQGLEGPICLPPGLAPGDRFSSRMSEPDLVNFTTQRKIAVFTVRDRETIVTLHGSLELLHVDLELDGRPHSTWWCDQAGTVYRSSQHGSGLELLLDRKSSSDGTVLWPAASRPSAP